MMSNEQAQEFMEEWLREGCIECRECGTRIDVETNRCPECNWKNPCAELV